MRKTWIVVVGLAACGDGNSATPDAPMSIDGPVVSPDAPDPDALTAEQVAAIGQLSPLPAPPADLTNAFADNPAAARLGQMLFFDKGYSGALAVADDGTNGGLGQVGETGKVACVSCHAPGSATLDDQRSAPNNVSLGADFMTRNAPGIVNSSFYTWTNWGGRFDSQWSLPLAVAENVKIMKSTRLQVAHLLYAKYRTEYNAIFPVALDTRLDPLDANAFPAIGKPGDAAGYDGLVAADKLIIDRIFANYGKAIEAYLRLVVSRNSRFDQFVAGDRTALSHSEIRGMKLFLSKGCVACHSGPDFTDNDFHALVVPQIGPHVPATDLGRFTDVVPLLASPFNTNGVFSDNTQTGKLASLAQVATQTGQFRTKSLRGGAMSGPFMHAGQFAALGDVITFYNAGGGDPGATGVVKDARMVPLHLSDADQADLVAFLGTLDGAPVAPSLVVDTSN